MDDGEGVTVDAVSGGVMILIVGMMLLLLLLLPIVGFCDSGDNGDGEEEVYDGEKD